MKLPKGIIVGLITLLAGDFMLALVSFVISANVARSVPAGDFETLWKNIWSTPPYVYYVWADSVARILVPILAGYFAAAIFRGRGIIAGATLGLMGITLTIIFEFLTQNAPYQAAPNPISYLFFFLETTLGGFLWQVKSGRKMSPAIHKYP